MGAIKPAEKKGDIFLNPVYTSFVQPGSMGKMMWKYMTNKEQVIPAKQLGPFVTDASIYQTPPKGGLRVTWMGHSSLLIEIDGKRILTDPAWSGRASFVQFAGPKRFFPPPLTVQQLPKLDAVIISHDHYDHLDYSTIRKFVDVDTRFITSLGVGRHLASWGIDRSRITELDWGGSTIVGNDLTITATPSRHFSGRWLNDRCHTLWSSFVLKGSRHNVFFGADSGWFPGFKDIGDEYGPFDLTILEIGAYDENWEDLHMGPDKATNAHLALRGKVMMPVHWATFNLGMHAWDEPVKLILPLANEKKITLYLPEPGLPVEVTGEEHISRWWER